MKICLVKDRPGRYGGLEKYTHYLKKTFEEADADITFLSDKNFSKRPKFGGWQLRHFDRECRKWLESHPSDVVFGMNRHSFLTHYRAGCGCHRAFLEKRKDTRLKALSHPFNPMQRTQLTLERATLESPTLKKLIVNSKMVAEEFLKFYDFDPSKLTIVHNGVEWHEFQGTFNSWEQERPSLIKRFGLEPSYLQLLFVGNGFSRKGLPLLLDSLASSKLPIQLIVVGKDKRLKHFEARAEDLGVKAKFFGHCSHMRPFYQVADALIIPSLYDPFANVTLEALAMGLYVISSPHNGGKEVLTPDLGEVLPRLTKEAIIQALQNLSPKEADAAELIRDKVKRYDFATQLKKITDICL